MTRQTVPDEPMRGIWKPAKQGEEVEGVYVRMQPAKDPKYGAEYILESGGEEMKLPCHELLQNKMSKVKAGAYVWITYKGKSGKAFSYQVDFDPDHKPAAPPQNRLTEPISDPSGALLQALKKADGWEDDAFWEEVAKHFKNPLGTFKLVDKLKQEGKIVRDGDMWRAT